MPAPRNILGISAYYHDAAAALVMDGKIVSAAQEERFTRKKNDPDFPRHAQPPSAFQLRQPVPSAARCGGFLRQAGFEIRAPARNLFGGGSGRLAHFPDRIVQLARRKTRYAQGHPCGDTRVATDCPILFTAHHQAHAASAFYPSPFDEAAVLTIDGVGEWATTTIGHGRGRAIQILKELRFTHSLGLLYSAFTSYCGFRINSGEYKLMGLAPYGEPKYAAAIRRELMDIKPDGSFWLNPHYFNFLSGTTMTNEKFHALFGGPPRGPQETIEDQRHMDVARSIQMVTEEIMLLLARHARELTGLKDLLCMAGGVALNCVANGIILREKDFRPHLDSARRR